ncbi:MAG: hypothetical protein ACI8W8_003279 [Rhodothermales bacterium]|jgi:hypothetical protein
MNRIDAPASKAGKQETTMYRILFASLFFSIMAQAQVVDRTITIEDQAPASNWRLLISEIWMLGDELIVVSEFSRQGDIGAAVITTVGDSVTIRAPKSLKIRHYVLGKEWNWGDAHRYPRHYAMIEAELNRGKRLFKRTPPRAPIPVEARFIVVFKQKMNKGKLSENATSLAAQYNGRDLKPLAIINGFVGTFSPADAARIQALPIVKYIERD